MNTLNNNISNDFISLYFIDLDQNSFDIYHVNGLREEVKSVARNAISYTEGIRHYIDTFVEEPYKELVTMASSPEYIRSHLATRPDYSIAYTVKDNDLHQKHFEMHFIRSDFSADSSKILLGWKCVDSHYNQLEEQALLLAQSLSEANHQKDMLVSLAGIYVSLHFVNLKERTFHEINCFEYVHQILQDHVDASKAIAKIVQSVVKSSHRSDVLNFFNLDTISERIGNKKILSHEFEGTNLGWCRASFIPVTRDEYGAVTETLFAVQQIDEEKKLELEYNRMVKESLENTNMIYKEMFDMQMVAIVAIREDTHEILYINNAAMHLFGKDSVKMYHKDYWDLITQSLINSEEILKLHQARLEDSGTNHTYDCSITTRDGRSYSILVQSRRIQVLNGKHILLNSLTDITEQKLMEEKLILLSKTDGLTKIRNRMSGEQSIEYALQQGAKGMFCLFDVDSFKYYNDTYGHVMGDWILQGIADCLKNIFRDDDVIMRLGGDEFAVFAQNVTSRKVCESILSRLIKRIEALHFDGVDKTITISMGVILCDNSVASSFDCIYQQADTLMYECKKIAGSAFQIENASTK